MSRRNKVIPTKVQKGRVVMERQQDVIHHAIGNADVLIIQDYCTGLNEDEVQKILAAIAQQALQHMNACDESS